MPLRMMEQSKAFPKKSHIDLYKPLIDAALNASLGEDGLPKVAIEDFANAILAAKAANSIRTFSTANNHNLWVSCPPNSKSVFVYKSDKPRRTREKKGGVLSDVSAAPKAPETPAA
jgi:hypothetical protein